MVSRNNSTLPDVSFMDLILNILDYCYLIPINIYFTIDWFNLIMKYWIEKSHKTEGEVFKITNPEAISTLDHIDYVIFDKTGTLTQKQFSLNSVCFNNRSYLVEHDFQNDIFQIKYDANNPFNKSRQLQSIFSIDSEFNNFQEFKSEGANFSPKKTLQKEKSSPLEYKDTKTTKLNLRKKLSSPLEIIMKKDSIEDANLFELDSSQECPCETQYNNKTDFEKIVCSGHNDIIEFFKCLSLTHPIGLMLNQDRKVIRKKELGEDDLKKEAYNYEDNLLINFCNHYGLGFDSCKLASKNHHLSYMEASSSITYCLKDTRNNEFNYNVVGINEYSYSRKRFSIFLQDIDKRNVLYCKGKYDAMKERLNLSSDQRIHYDNLTKNYSDKGLRIVVFGRRILEKEELYRYFNKFNNLKKSVVSQKQELENLAIEMESDLDLIGVIGIKEKLRPDAEKCVEELNKTNSKIWIFTGDSYTNAFNVGVNVSLYPAIQENSLIHFKDINGDNLRYFIRDILSEMKNCAFESYQKENALDESNAEKEKEMNLMGELRLQKEKKFSKIASKEIKNYFHDKLVMINGDCLSVILKDQFLKLNFIFILAVAQKVVGYNFSPDQKSDLVKIIQEKFPNSPTVLAIGDGYNDILMLRASDVSIEICDNIEDSCNGGDIKMKNLGDLTGLMRIYGRKISKTLGFLIRLRFYQSFFFIFCIFFSNSLFYGKLFANFELFLYFGVLQTFDFLIICLWNLEEKKDVRSDLYFPHKMQKNNKFSFFLFVWLLFYAGVAALITYLFEVSYIMNDVNADKDDQGKQPDAYGTNEVIFLVMVIINQEQIFIFYIQNKIKIIMIFLHLISLIVITIAFCWIGTNRSVNFNQDVSHFIFNNAWLVILAIMIILIFKYMFFMFLDAFIKQMRGFFIKVMGNNYSNFKLERTDGM